MSLRIVRDLSADQKNAVRKFGAKGSFCGSCCEGHDQSHKGLVMASYVMLHLSLTFGIDRQQPHG